MHKRKYNPTPEFRDFAGQNSFRFGYDTYYRREWLGSGVSGQVAKFSTLDGAKNIAVKYEYRDFDQKFNQGKDFEREAACWRKVHPNHVQAEVSGDPQRKSKQHFLLMPYIAHETFGAVFEKSRSIGDIATYLIAIALCVEALHQHQLVHRDLFVSNVMLDVNSTSPAAWLIDFGRTYLMGTIAPNVNSVPNEVGYSVYAPEICGGDSSIVDKTQDYYGLGYLVKYSVDLTEAVQSKKDPELKLKFDQLWHIGEQLQMTQPSKRWNLQQTIAMLDILFITQLNRPLQTQNAQLENLVGQCKKLSSEIAEKPDATKNEKLRGLVFLFLVFTKQILNPKQAVDQTKALFPNVAVGVFSRRTLGVLTEIENLPCPPRISMVPIAHRI